MAQDKSLNVLPHSQTYLESYLICDTAYKTFTDKQKLYVQYLSQVIRTSTDPTITSKLLFSQAAPSEAPQHLPANCLAAPQDTPFTSTSVLKSTPSTSYLTPLKDTIPTAAFLKGQAKQKSTAKQKPKRKTKDLSSRSKRVKARAEARRKQNLNMAGDMARDYEKLYRSTDSTSSEQPQRRSRPRGKRGGKKTAEAKKELQFAKTAKIGNPNSSKQGRSNDTLSPQDGKLKPIIQDHIQVSMTPNTTGPLSYATSFPKPKINPQPQSPQSKNLPRRRKRALARSEARRKRRLETEASRLPHVAEAADMTRDCPVGVPPIQGTARTREGSTEKPPPNDSASGEQPQRRSRPRGKRGGKKTAEANKDLQFTKALNLARIQEVIEKVSSKN